MLEARGARYSSREYFKDKPTAAEVRDLAAITPGGVRALVSTKSRRFKEMALEGKDLSDDEWADLLAAEPGLWRRPITIRDGQVVIGFDAPSLEQLLS